MRYALLILVLAAAPATAKDYMVTLNDQERAALKEILDVAVKAAGIQNAGVTANALYFANKLDKASEIIERKDDDSTKSEAPK